METCCAHTCTTYPSPHTDSHRRDRDGWHVMKYGFLWGLATLKQTFNEIPTALFRVQDYNSALHALSPPLSLRVRECVCVYIPTSPKGIKAAFLTRVHPRIHSFITRLISPSLLPFIIEACNSSQHFAVQYSSIHLFVSKKDLPVHFAYLLFYIHYPNVPPFTASTFFPFICTFLPHQSLP